MKLSLKLRKEKVKSMTVYKPLEYPEKAKKMLNEIDNNASEVLRDEYGIDIEDTKAIYTIAVKFLESAANVLGAEARANKGKAEVEIHKFMKMGVSIRENEDAEKAGNLVPTLTPGESFKMAIKNDDYTESDDK
jgi:hypothetical protein